MDVDLLVRHDSSKVAAAALFMANYRVNRENWPEDLENFSGYSLEDLAECMETMYKLELLHSELPLQAIRTKFTKSMSVVQCCSPSSPVCTASIYNSVF
ncbi:cyclin-A1-like [Synchiropus splendidus]|uniref:cyclin-A1-like n=1 Tax=Synchiropus splendidus TaxID=270530 RepID=UPI00237D8B40|nr:cyclin-A1-like [Synchiropus splendidus]